MKRYGVFVVVLLMLGALAACGGGQRVEVSCDSFYAAANQRGSIDLAVGETFELALCSNATTGYQWDEAAVISNPAVVEEAGMVYEEPASSGGSVLVGAPGIQTWTFKAAAVGSAEISLTYSQPWQGGEKGAWTYTLQVAVR